MLRFERGERHKRIKPQLVRQFALYYAQEKVSRMLNKSKMAKAFITYLAMNRGEVVGFDEVYNTISRGKKSKEKTNSIKVLAFRTRTMLGEVDEYLRECVESRAGGYSWNLGMCEVDVLELEELASELCEVTVCSDDVKRKVQSFLTLYTPEILPEFEKEAWAQAYAQSLKMQALQAGLYILPLLEDVGEEELATELSQVLCIPRERK